MNMADVDKSEPVRFHGLTGNVYVICSHKDKLEQVCKSINKSISAIYYSIQYECWAIRIKARHHKIKIKELMPG